MDMVAAWVFGAVGLGVLYLVVRNAARSGTLEALRAHDEERMDARATRRLADRPEPSDSDGV